MTEGIGSPLIAGVELGGTKCVCILASGPEDIREEVRIPTTTPDETLGAIRATLERWHAESGFAAIGVASFGPIDLDPDSARYAHIVGTTKPGWDEAPLTRFMDGFGVPAAVDTDVAGAALAEGLWGAAQGLSNHVYITVGTGIGAGAVVNGRAVRGLGHPELGHLRVGRLTGDTWPGFCTYHGDCVEGLASGPAIQARAGRPAEQLDADDPAWAMAVHALAGLIHNLVLTACPQRVLIGGGVATGQPWIFRRLRQAVVESLAGYGATPALTPAIDDFIRAPALGDRAGPLGAIAVGLTALENGGG